MNRQKSGTASTTGRSIRQSPEISAGVSECAQSVPTIRKTWVQRNRERRRSRLARP
jgi:hypothetical protein